MLNILGWYVVYAEPCVVLFWRVLSCHCYGQPTSCPNLPIGDLPPTQPPSCAVLMTHPCVTAAQMPYLWWLPHPCAGAWYVWRCSAVYRLHYFARPRVHAVYMHSTEQGVHLFTTQARREPIAWRPLLLFSPSFAILPSYFPSIDGTYEEGPRAGSPRPSLGARLRPRRLHVVTRNRSGSVRISGPRPAAALEGDDGAGAHLGPVLEQ